VNFLRQLALGERLGMGGSERDDIVQDMSSPVDVADAELVATVVQNRGDELHAAEGVFVFTVTEGQDFGKTFTLDGSALSKVLIGQSPACDVRLTDRQVSRRHVALELTEGGVRLRDLGSTNGTWVDRVKVMEVELRGDERVRVGSTVLHVEQRAASTGAPPPRANGFGRVVGASLPMRRVYPLCGRLAASNVPVIIEGETGTGKEVLAEALHEGGPRANGPFVVFDCTAIPPNLVESELFGHERGAFTGAVSTRRGVFEQAQGGTLLIDEIGDLELALQPKLLRAIERGEVRRVGGDHWIRVDARVLAATRRDLDREVQAGRFRDDLFHRLAVGRVELPPLRDRQGDVSLLAHRFWQELGGDAGALPQETLARWEDYSWPGNVRELRNAVARRLALGELAELDARGATNVTSEQGPDKDLIDKVLALPYIQARDMVMEEFEQRYVASVLALHQGDVAHAAAASGIGRRYFQKLRARSAK
jgi:two-component system response regulator HydG